MKRYKATIVPKDDTDGPTEDNLSTLRLEVTFTVGDGYVERWLKTLPTGSVPGTALARLMAPRGVRLGEGAGWRVESLEELHPNGLPVRDPYDPSAPAPLADASEEELDGFLERDDGSKMPIGRHLPPAPLADATEEEISSFLDRD